MAGERWSYQVVEITPRISFWKSGPIGLSQHIQDELNRQGMQGWELVSVTQTPAQRGVRLYLKRTQ